MYMTLSLRSVWRAADSRCGAAVPVAGLLSRNLGWFNQVISSQRKGQTCLPNRLGLSTDNYHRLATAPRYHQSGRPLCSEAELDGRDDLRQELLDLREDEFVSLRELLVGHRAGVDESELLVADLVAAACMGGSHLWHDMGLASRQQLSDLLQQNFPSLARANDRDMKWKKFFYKQLCEQGGGYVCRAPSCDECSAYSDCFGPEV